jgi:hypothetical protein
MTTMTHPAESPVPFRLAGRVTLAILIWAGTAAAVLLLHRTLGPISPELMTAAKSCAIAVGGFLYARLSRDCSIDHALLVGVGWLLLGIATEVAVSSSTGHSWFALLGSPARPYLRDVLLFFWVAAPLCFARRRKND